MDVEAKKRILETTIALLSEEPNTGKITVRRIAERAGVGIGAINYHFQSKDNLLNEAVGALMLAEANKWTSPESAADDPAMRLRALLKQTSKIGMQFPHLLEISVKYELEQGNFSVAEITLPMLRDIAQGRLSESEVRLTAVQLITAMQILFLRRRDVARFTGIDITQEADFDAVIDKLIDNHIFNLQQGGSL